MYRLFLSSVLFILFIGCGTEDSVPSPSSVYNSCTITLQLPAYFENYYTSPSPGTTKNTLDFTTIRSTYLIVNSGTQICPMWQSKNIVICADSSSGDSLSLSFSFSCILDTNAKMLREIVFHSDGHDSTIVQNLFYTAYTHKHSVDLSMTDQMYSISDSGITVFLKDSSVFSSIIAFKSRIEKAEQYYSDKDQTITQGLQYWRGQFRNFAYADSNMTISINLKP